MKKTLALVLVALIVLLAGSARGAGGDSGWPDTTILLGGKGVRAPDGTLRYVTLTTGRQTIVSVVRVKGGQVVRWRLVRGYFGVPVIGLDGATEGISRDGRTLVLVAPTDGVDTRFAVIDTKSLRLRRIALHGWWSYDTISPDASTLFLIEHLRTIPNSPYRVRAFDVAARRLVPEAIVDRREAEAIMRGRAVTRATSADGRWAYTLYARARQEPFVHALDTLHRKAYCIDLPLKVRLARQLGLRLRLGRGGLTLAVRNARGQTAAVVDTRTFSVRRS